LYGNGLANKSMD